MSVPKAPDHVYALYIAYADIKSRWGKAFLPDDSPALSKAFVAKWRILVENDQEAAAAVIRLVRESLKEPL